MNALIALTILFCITSIYKVREYLKSDKYSNHQFLDTYFDFNYIGLFHVLTIILYIALIIICGGKLLFRLL